MRVLRIPRAGIEVACVWNWNAGATKLRYRRANHGEAQGRGVHQKADASVPRRVSTRTVVAGVLGGWPMATITQGGERCLTRFKSPGRLRGLRKSTHASAARVRSWQPT